MTDDYKQKYEDLMKRCAEFMQDFAPPSPYELGFKAGWEAAKQEFHKDNTYVPDTTKTAKTMDLQWKTMDLQWPRDQQAWPTPPTTNPWPPGSLDRTYGRNICGGCGMDLNKLTNYVCYMPNCPSQKGTAT
jgi:hypothetical protein